MHTLRHRSIPMAALVVLVGVAACSSSATPTPAPTAAPTMEPTTGASAALPSTGLPSIALPSGVAFPSGAANAPDPATIVSADMAASVIGGSPTKVDVPGLSGLPVNVVSYQSSTGDSLTVLVEQVPGGLPANALQVAAAMAGAQGSDLQQIGGIGDAAVKQVDANSAVIAFVKGNLIVVLGGQSGSGAAAAMEPKVEALAQQVAGKL